MKSLKAEDKVSVVKPLFLFFPNGHQSLFFVSELSCCKLPYQPICISCVYQILCVTTTEAESMACAQNVFLLSWKRKLRTVKSLSYFFKPFPFFLFQPDYKLLRRRCWSLAFSRRRGWIRPRASSGIIQSEGGKKLAPASAYPHQRCNPASCAWAKLSRHGRRGNYEIYDSFLQLRDSGRASRGPWLPLKERRQRRKQVLHRLCNTWDDQRCDESWWWWDREVGGGQPETPLHPTPHPTGHAPSSISLRAAETRAGPCCRTMRGNTWDAGHMATRVSCSLWSSPARRCTNPPHPNPTLMTPAGLHLPRPSCRAVPGPSLLNFSDRLWRRTGLRVFFSPPSPTLAVTFPPC